MNTSLEDLILLGREVEMKAERVLNQSESVQDSSILKFSTNICNLFMKMYGFIAQGKFESASEPLSEINKNLLRLYGAIDEYNVNCNDKPFCVGELGKFSYRLGLLSGAIGLTKNY